MAPAQSPVRARKAVVTGLRTAAAGIADGVSTAAAAAAPAPAKPAAAPPRPIRFVTSNDEPLTKRRRISAACRTCQRKKTKCSGERPDCKTCQESDIDCLGYAEQHHGGSRVARLPLKLPKPQLQAGVSTDEPQRSPHSQDQDGFEDAADQKNPPSDSIPEPLNLTELYQYADVSRRHDAQPQGFKNDFTSTQDLPSNNQRYRSRVPYFRYFGPTAMVPGFKQMVVDLSHHQEEFHPVDSSNASPEDSKGIVVNTDNSDRQKSSPISPPISFYSKDNGAVIEPLIAELCGDFFTHLGGNYPFLTRSTFMQDLKDKKLDAILVDAVCAIAARFSQNPVIVAAGKTAGCNDNCADSAHKSKYGCIFARRAMSAVTTAFACPTLAAVQACLLLAYEQFGADRDSGLWIYLGLSIRMAQDLGLQKLEGLHYEGYLGPTPKTAKSGPAGKVEEQRRAEKYHVIQSKSNVDPAQAKMQRLVEKERINTFWAIFFLDRVVSSGTGRPVTLRDKDIEISFPSEEEHDSANAWPAPFPALIRIIHSYGRVTNLLNNIREVNQLTPEILKQLVAAEDDLIGIYQRLSPKLHFSAANFQHYLKHSQATNFILLHFWFHTLIVLLHQPTLLHSFEDRIEQMFPNSQELSLSSAKTIADILSFAELLDSKSFIGNPFTSQPMYFAACAFLLESASHSSSRPQSRAETPPISPFRTAGFPSTLRMQQTFNDAIPDFNNGALRPPDLREHTKKSLLAAAASQNYQRCYKALKALETYWAGARYIVTVLDQKAKGCLDPLLYTTEYLDGYSETCDTTNRTVSPGGRSKPAPEAGPRALDAGHRAHLAKLKSAVGPQLENRHLSKISEPSQAIGWSLTGSSDSPDSNLDVLYQTARDEIVPQLPPNSLESAISSGQPPLNIAKLGAGELSRNIFQFPRGNPATAPQTQVPLFVDDDAISTISSNHHLLSPISNTASLVPSASTYSPVARTTLPHVEMGTPAARHPGSSLEPFHAPRSLPYGSIPQSASESGLTPYSGLVQSTPESGIDENFELINHGYGPASHLQHNYDDMIIESQSIDTSAIGLDSLLWLGYVPEDALDNFELQQGPSTRG